MKELGRLFTGEMVRAIIGGTKSQTRRIVKPRKDANFGCELSPNELAGEINGWDYTNSEYRIGDRIWVRETLILEHQVEHGQKPPFQDGRPILDDVEYGWIQPHYKATDPNPELDYEDGEGPKCKWTPSIFMPRWASRITLEITGIRIERLHRISEEDCAAEGMQISVEPGTTCAEFGLCQRLYRKLWVSINGAKSWDANPWVFVIEFRRIK